MVAEDADDHLDSALAQRADHLVIVVQDVLALRVREHIHLAGLPVVVDVVGEQHHIVREQASVFGLELEHVQRVGVVDLDPADDLLLAFLADDGRLPGHVLDEIHEVALLFGNLDAFGRGDGLQGKDIGGLLLVVKGLQGEVQGIRDLLVRSDDDLAAVLDADLGLRIGPEGGAMFGVVRVDIVRIVLDGHVHALLRRAGQVEIDLRGEGIAAHLDDAFHPLGVRVAEGGDQVRHIGIGALVDLVDNDGLIAGAESQDCNDGRRDILVCSFHGRHALFGLGEGYFRPPGRIVQRQVVAVRGGVLEQGALAVVHLPVGGQALGGR